MLSHQSESVCLAVGLIALLVAVTNLGLWAAWKRRNNNGQASEWLRKLGEGLRFTETKTEKKIEELSRRVEQLRKDKPDSH